MPQQPNPVQLTSHLSQKVIKRQRVLLLCRPLLVWGAVVRMIHAILIPCPWPRPVKPFSVFLVMEVQCDPRLASLYVRAITHYRDYERHAFIVPDSIPILYFGNLRDYRHSAIKIVTVGLNPSDAEFRESRFGAEVMSSLRPETLEPALSGYFSAKPYSAWFSAFETLLQPLGSSFYGREYAGEAPPWWMPQRNVALHTDLCSPLATTPRGRGYQKGLRINFGSGAFRFGGA